MLDIRNISFTELWHAPQFKFVAGAVLACIGLGTIVAFTTVVKPPQGTMHDTAEVTGSTHGWQAVAPGRVEPLSGETKISSPAVGVVTEVLVKANDTVFAGEPLIRFQNDEVRARLKSAQAQVAMRERARNDQKVTGKEADRRRAEDAFSEAETAVFDARAAVDSAAVARRGGGAVDVETARAILARAQEQLKARTATLRSATAAGPLPGQPDALLNVARADLAAARAAFENTTIRAPIAGTVLQINVKVGETVMPSPPQPLLMIGDVSTLRVRVELDDRDVGDVMVGQPVSVQATAFPGREFSGKVTTIAPTVEPANVATRGTRNLTDVDIVEVLIDLSDAGPLLPGMKVDAYFRRNAHAER